MSRRRFGQECFGFDGRGPKSAGEGVDVPSADGRNGGIDGRKAVQDAFRTSNKHDQPAVHRSPRWQNRRLGMVRSRCSAVIP